MRLPLFLKSISFHAANASSRSPQLLRLQPFSGVLAGSPYRSRRLTYPQCHFTTEADTLSWCGYSVRDDTIHYWLAGSMGGHAFTVQYSRDADRCMCI